MGILGTLLAIVIAAPAVHAAADVKFKNCSAWKQRTLSEASDEGIESMNVVQAQLEERLDVETYSKHETRQLKVAARRIECVIRKMPKIRYICANKYHPNALARTIPIIGNGVKIFEGAFRTGSYKLSAILVHEASHKCGSNDRIYYYQNGLNPNQDAKKNWASTASTYDWWSMFGFCIPGRDC